MSHGRAAFALTCIASFLVSACTSGAPTSTRSARPSEAPSQAPVLQGDPVAVVAGTCINATLDEGTSTPADDGVQRFRNGRFVCTVAADDPRIAGTETAAPWDVDLWRTSMAHGAQVQWGSSVRANANGRWNGQGAGIFSTDRGDIIAMWYQGTGDYEGLTLFELWTGTGPLWTIEGLIVPGAPPNPQDLPPIEAPASPPPAQPSAAAVPSGAPPAVTFGPMTEVAGTWESVAAALGSATIGEGRTHYRNGLLAQIQRLNDPRVSGAVTASWNIDRWETQDHGTVDVQWGAIRMDNAGGAWIGTYAGIRVGPAGDIMVAWYRGTGDYSGFGCFELLRGDGSVEGQVFPLTSPDAMPTHA